MKPAHEGKETLRSLDQFLPVLSELCLTAADELEASAHSLAYEQLINGLETLNELFQAWGSAFPQKQQSELRPYVIDLLSVVQDLDVFSKRQDIRHRVSLLRSAVPEYLEELRVHGIAAFDRSF